MYDYFIRIFYTYSVSFLKNLVGIEVEEQL